MKTSTSELHGSAEDRTLLPSSSKPRRSVQHPRRNDALRRFRRAVRLSRRQLQAAYPYVAYLLHALVEAPARRSARHRGSQTPQPHAARG